MSAIGGIAFFEPYRSEPRVTLDTLTAGLAPLGPDGRADWSDGEAGLVFRGFHTTEASRREPQPVRSADGVVLVWDGRLDNGDEIRRALSGGLGGESGPAELALATYLKHGVDGLADLVGDFALSLWDPARRRVVLARDAFGARTLFYRRSHFGLVWSTSLEALLGATDSPELDEEFLADFLSLSARADATPYRTHLAVPPGTALIFGEAGMERRSLWRPDLGRELQYTREEEYEQHFKDLFYEAVRCRMDVQGTVCCDLSGGLDSSSIVCVGDELLRSGQVSADRMETLSYVFDEAKTSDERRFIQVVERHLGRKGKYLREEDHRILSDLPLDEDLAYPSVLHLFAARQQHIQRAVAESGARVLLRGTGGDHVMLSETTFPYELADFMSRGRLIKLARELRRWAWAKKSSALKLLWGGGIAPLLPRSVQGRFGSYRRVPDWFMDEYVERFRLRERMQGIRPTADCRLPSTGYHYSTLQKIFLPVSWGFYVQQGTVEVSYPFLDRRLVEFALALPMSQKLRPGQNRSVMRRALADVLPKEIAGRRSKQGPDEAILKAFARGREMLAELFDRALVYDYGIVDPKRFKPVLQRAQHGMLSDTPVMLRVLALEVWLRARRSQDAIRAKSA